MGDINNEKLVSIIIPAYNVEKYIDECISSILAQTYRNIEIIVVDDGSTDSTWRHIQDFVSLDSRVKGFHRTNSGVSTTRNFAIEQASGDYISFVDGDDYVSNDMVAIMVDTIERDSSDWVNCQYHRTDDSGNLLEEYDFLQGNIKTQTDDMKLNLILNTLADYQLGYEVWNKLYKASIIKYYHISFIQDCHIGEDLAFNICYAFYANSISSIAARPYYYRIRSNSTMGSVNSIKKNFEEHLIFVKGIQPYFENAFSGQIKEKYYQLVFKLMAHAGEGHTADDMVSAIKATKDSYYLYWLNVALKHKSSFTDFYSYDKAKIYYRYGLYIKTKIKGDVFGDIYLKIYDVYRKLRKRPTIGEWKV